MSLRRTDQEHQPGLGEIQQLSGTQEQSTTSDEGPACLSCRRRKLRCSRELPTCTQCQRLNCECIYDQRKQKPGLKTGAVENLNRRLEILEKLLLDSNGDPKSGSAPDANDVQGCLFHASLLIANQFQSASNGRSSPSQNDADLINCHRPLQSQGNDRGEVIRDFANSSRKRRRVEDVLDVDQAPGITSRQIAPAQELPDQAVVDKIIEVYFANIHHWIPIIHRTRFESRLKSSTEYYKLIIPLHAIIAVTIRHLEPDDLEDGFDVENQTQISQNAVMQNAFDDLSIENLQAILLIAYDKLGNGQMVGAWSLLGHLTRAVEYLELNLEPNDTPDTTLLVPLRLLEKSRTWAETEERRRVFWFVFLLDRFCCVTSGWPTSLTAENVKAQLPCNGALWRRGEPATTPFLGLWDKSTAKIGSSVTYLPTHKASPSDQPQQSNASPGNNVVDTSSLGAVAYRIEATASLRQVASFFLQQPVNFQNRAEVSTWLTRFKELDLRLVHWKQFLSPRWKDGNISQDETVVKMDTNLTLAHVLHNTSMILLHQHIAFPPMALTQTVNLPSSCSADTCVMAASEVHAIAQKYLKHAVIPMVNSEFAFCAFIAARVLLVNWRFLSSALPNEFFGLIECLEEMSLRWRGTRARAEDQTASHTPMRNLDLAGRYARQLQHLHQKCLADSTFVTEILFYNGANAAMETTDFMPSSITRPNDAPFAQSPTNTQQIHPQGLRRSTTNDSSTGVSDAKYLSPRSRSIHAQQQQQQSRNLIPASGTQSQIDHRNAMFRYQQPLAAVANTNPHHTPQIPVYNSQTQSFTSPRLTTNDHSNTTTTGGNTTTYPASGAHPDNPSGPVSHFTSYTGIPGMPGLSVTGAGGASGSGTSDDELAVMSNSLLEQQFASMDRVIRYDGTDFGGYDPGLWGGGGGGGGSSGYGV